MRKVRFTQIALDDMLWYKTGNQKLVFKILELIDDIQRPRLKASVNPNR